ncbi:MAG TPA: methyltransferase domain-containing protein [Candidatus Chromulinivoraceae bacterium]|nr:methyltransferase domain-containing protein [Candidatus Chromulinivoraceae bacterium]
MDKLVIDKALKKRGIALSDPNKITLNSYNRYANEYIRNTVPTIAQSPLQMREWIDTALGAIPQDGVVFEIGSATIRDASYMRQQGYKVICSDATESFIEIMLAAGEPAVHFNVLEDKLADQYHMIYANGVFPHFTVEEIQLALQNIHSSLKPEGILAFSIKQGMGEEWIKEKLEDVRFAHYWSQQDITDVLNEEGFSLQYTSFNTGLYPSHRWLNIICKKEARNRRK